MNINKNLVVLLIFFSVFTNIVVFATPFANMTENSGQTTPPMTIFSSAGIVFGYLVPPNYCNPGQTSDCVDPVSYNVPVTVQGVLGNGTHFSTTTNLTFSFVPRNDYIYLFMIVVVGIIISGVSYRIIFRKKNKKNDYDEEGNKKPKKGKRVEDLMKERRSRNAAREGTLMKRLQDLD